MTPNLHPLPNFPSPRATPPDSSDSAVALAARRLMAEIDACYLNGPDTRVLDLESRLEELLWDLEHVLEGLHGEGGHDERLDIDPTIDDEAGVEDQFVAIYRSFINPRDAAYGNQPETCEYMLRGVLECACMSGMAPKGLRIPEETRLLPLARELYEDRERLIARYRSSASSRARSAEHSPGQGPPSRNSRTAICG